ncbi:hypothetical protein GCM10023093_07450 [Nemorincola caseinilytica]|uniref:Uncharacterized protein n=1 Tax=Nemorincola caseinilytica TaxID=2054315 RepID=A0ABP8N917_9BACT
MVAVPVVCPEVNPIDVATDATAGSLLDQVPPDTEVLNKLEYPVHRVRSPDIMGIGCTVTIASAMQPLPEVYVIEVVPADMPETTPSTLIVPTAGVLLLHVPPAVALLNAVVAPIHMLNGPVISSGDSFTVTTLLK